MRPGPDTALLPPRSSPVAWPSLDYTEWQDTCTTLHLWTQIAGKIRLACTRWANHSWHVVQYVTTRGLTSSPIPYGSDTFELEFDFFDHVLRITRSDGRRGSVELEPRSVADFYHALMAELGRLDIRVRIHGSPNEVADPIPFARDEVHGSYDAEYANRFARVIGSSARVLSDFRGEFIGKASPVHFFWGSFDLAVTRFSGRRAPPHPGGAPNVPDWINGEAYSHEVSSVGFWPGGEVYPSPVYYAYAYPAPPGFADARVEPAAARWDDGLSEFLLPYDAVRTGEDPDAALLAFCRSTYSAAADLGHWDRTALEWPPGGRPRPPDRIWTRDW